MIIFWPFEFIDALSLFFFLYSVLPFEESPFRREKTFLCRVIVSRAL